MINYKFEVGDRVALKFSDKVGKVTWKDTIDKKNLNLYQVLWDGDAEIEFVEGKLGGQKCYPEESLRFFGVGGN